MKIILTGVALILSGVMIIAHTMSQNNPSLINLIFENFIKLSFGVVFIQFGYIIIEMELKGSVLSYDIPREIKRVLIK